LQFLFNLKYCALLCHINKCYLHLFQTMNKTVLRIAFIALVSFLTAAKPASAQLNNGNLSTINVDQLSDKQISDAVQQAHSSGLTDDQLISQARQRGLSAAEATKLVTRMASLRTQGASADTDVITTSRKVNQPAQNDTAPPPASSTQLPIFGSNLFSSRDLKFEPNLKLATPVNYVLGPDDQLNINVYGNSLVNWKLNVSPEGNINIPGVGILNVAGKTVEQATAAIKSKLAANNYAIGRGTNVQVTLGDIRSIKVIITGQVVKPGTFTVPSLATVFNALSAAGGPSANGTFRQIQVIRNNRIIRTLDIYDFLVRGDQKNNIGLRDQDIIYVPTYRNRVSIVGEIKVPAYFEVIPGETLQNVIDFAGGFTDRAYTARIRVSQVNEQQRRISDIFENDFRSYTPLRGDAYTVDAILDRYENRVTLNGAVFRPGEFELSKGLTLSQLITKAAGLREDAFMNRATITRLKPDNTSETIAFSVRDIVNKVTDIPLQREDVITISSIFDLRIQYQVSITGEVRSPGNYPYSDSLRIEDLILKAGGFTEGASTMRIEVARRVTDSDPRSKDTRVAQVFTLNVNRQLTPEQNNFVLRPFDIVSVYTLPGYESQRTVKVEGEVLYPGIYTLEKKGEKISDIIKRAGGLTAMADVEGGTLRRENTAILGVDPARADTGAISRDRAAQLNRLKQINRDTTSDFRNNYVGIELGKILENPGSKIDLLLEANDLIRIPKEQQIVKVNGEVLYPSAVVYSSGKSFKSYVSNAGGFSPNALERRAYVVYPNGTVKATHKVLFFRSYPSVKAGSEIYVPRKAPRRGISTQEVLGLTTGVASLGAIILGIISLNK
jgi:protein involved in polysaccharide export with SLBB domain